MVTPEVVEDEITPKEEVRKFLSSLENVSGSGFAYWKYIGEITSESRGSVCHSGLSGKKTPLSLGSGFLPTKKQLPVAERFWEWVTDKDKSPWRVLMQNGIELVRGTNGLPVGWILPKKTLLETPFTFQKNFAILTRVFTEKHENFEFWYLLVNKGVREDDALYLCSCLRYQDGKTTIQNQLLGSHWPLSDYVGYDIHSVFTNFDWKAYRSGNINPVSQYAGLRINGHFCQTKENNYKQFDPIKIPYTLSKGAFSQVKEYDLDVILDEFYKWQDEEGILA